MKAIALVVVRGGVAEVYEPLHVDCRVVDLDNWHSDGEQTFLPRGIGFEELIAEAFIDPAAVKFVKASNA